MRNLFAITFVRELVASFLGKMATAAAFMTKPSGGKYDIAHLVQGESQRVGGPVQDDEALFLFSVVRGMRMRAVLEIGGLAGFSALNFCRAFPAGETALVVTVDVKPVRKVADNHETIIKDAAALRGEDFAPLFERRGMKPVFDLIFLDAHAFDGQLRALATLRESGMATDETVIAMHDTCPAPALQNVTLGNKKVSVSGGGDGYVNDYGDVERRTANILRAEGYNIFNLHPHPDNLGKLPFRRGLTICQKSEPFE